MNSKDHKFHGEAGRKKSPEYNAWQQTQQRCFNPKYAQFHRYGGRGISVCDRWRNSYTAFLSDIGRRPSPSHTVERIDNNRGYEPGNCRWATRKEQARNRRNNVRVEFSGVSLTIAEWSEKTGIESHVLGARLRSGWPIERAIAVPVYASKGVRS